MFRISIMKFLSIRLRLLVIMNLIFFDGVFLSVFMFEWLFPYPLYLGSPQPIPLDSIGGNLPLLIFSIFFSNMVLSSFIFVTLPGFAFFPLSSAFLAYRAYIWGFLLSRLPTWLLLIAMPTIIFEGLGYCFAALAGTIVGLSWIKPQWVYGGGSLNRIESVKKALKECLASYFFVTIFQFLAAIIEATTLMII